MDKLPVIEMKPPDKEVELLTIIVAAFEQLDVTALPRTLAYLDDRYGVGGLIIDGRPQSN